MGPKILTLDEESIQNGWSVHRFLAAYGGLEEAMGKLRESITSQLRPYYARFKPEIDEESIRFMKKQLGAHYNPQMERLYRFGEINFVGGGVFPKESYKNGTLLRVRFTNDGSGCENLPPNPGGGLIEKVIPHLKEFGKGVLVDVLDVTDVFGNRIEFRTDL